MSKVISWAAMLLIGLVVAVPAVAQQDGVPEPKAAEKVTSSGPSIAVPPGVPEPGPTVSLEGDVLPPIVRDGEQQPETPKAAPKATEAKAGGAEAKASKAETKTETKELPKTGGVGNTSLLALGAGALLVGSGLLTVVSRRA